MINLMGTNNDTNIIETSLKTWVSLLTKKDVRVEAYILSIYFLSYIKTVLNLLVFIYPRAYTTQKRQLSVSHFETGENVVEEITIIQMAVDLTNQKAYSLICEELGRFGTIQQRNAEVRRVWALMKCERRRRRALGTYPKRKTPTARLYSHGGRDDRPSDDRLRCDAAICRGR